MALYYTGQYICWCCIGVYHSFWQLQIYHVY